MAHTVTQRVPIMLDFMQANQLLAACDQREEVLRAHLEHTRDEVVEIALVETIAAELANRTAFRLCRSEAVLDALHEATHAELDELAARDIPTALDTYWNRGS